MAKKHSKYVCEQCGFAQVGWAGKCPNCNAWGSLVETITASSSTSKGHAVSTQTLVSLSDIHSGEKTRYTTHISELDRVLGGGLVPGQVVLIAGEPGIGKSTILMQVSSHITDDVVYVAGEESATQLKLRADRLGLSTDTTWILEETNVDSVLASVEDFAKDKKVGLVIVDSIQTLTTADLSGVAGSVGQVRESTFRMTQWAKSHNVPLLLVGQVTKEGTVAGPATLAHMVDTVLWFEGDKNLSLRLLRSIKNRFGPTDEVGMFEMQENGLVPISGTHLLLGETTNVPGTATAVILEGTRPILVEVQALVVPSKLAMPRRVAQGIDNRRVEVILAVLTKHARMNMSDCDVFVNIAGGITVRETGGDLAVALAIASSYKEKILSKGLIAVGEVGLLGEIRAVAREKDRLKEAKRQGFSKFVSIQNTTSLKDALQKYLK